MEDPRLWNQLLAAESRSPALPRPPQPVQPKPKPRRRKQNPEDVRRMLGIAIGVVVALFVVVLVAAGIYAGKDLIATGGFGGFSSWREHRSEAGGYCIQFPNRLGGKEFSGRRPVFGGMMVTAEGQQFRNGMAVGVAYGDMDASANLDWNIILRGLRGNPQIEDVREVRLGTYPGIECVHREQGKKRLIRIYLVDRRLYETAWVPAGLESLDSPDVQKFFNSFRLLGREDLQPAVVASSAATAQPPADASPVGGVFGSSSSSRPALPDNYAAARRIFRTNLRQQGPAPQEWEPLRTPPGAERLSYRSGELTLTAYVDPQPADGAAQKKPAVLFLHGGFAFGDSDWEMADPYRQAGFVVMMPVLRGENGQPGHFTLYFDEVDDVLAAAEALGRLPYVDERQICVAGHSAGGSLAALAALAANRFAAAASLSGCMDQRLNEELAPFDTSDDREFRIRSPLDFATSFQCPARLFYGSQEDWAFSSTQETARRAKVAGRDVEAIRVPGDHFTSIPPAMRDNVTFFLQQCQAASSRAAPDPPPAATSRPAAVSGQVAMFQVRVYEGRLDVLSAARNALRSIPWADLSRLDYAESTGTLTVGVSGGVIDTGPAKAALEQAGFQIGWTSIRRATEPE